jgi:hypothetical protein
LRYGTLASIDPLKNTLMTSLTRRSFARYFLSAPGFPAIAATPQSGSTVQLRDRRILLLDVHAGHIGGRRFECSFRISKDGFRTLRGPEKYSFVLPEADTTLRQIPASRPRRCLSPFSVSNSQ